MGEDIKLRVLVKIKPKKAENLNDIFLILKNFNANTANFFKDLREKNYFEFYLDVSTIEDIKNKLEELAYLEIEEHDVKDNIQEFKQPKSASSDINNPYAFFTIATLDVFILLIVIEIIFKSLFMESLINGIINITKLSIFLTTLLKLAFSFLYFRGLLDIFQSTLVGRLFNVKIYGSKLNILSIFLLPIIGFYFINNPEVGFIFKIFGLFLIIFFVIATFISFEYLGISLKRNED